MKARGGEIERLASTFNTMLDRINGLINGMREMTDSIAHDLRSPITRIRGIAEMTLTTGESLDEYESFADFIPITMNRCMQCHEQMEVTNDCIACHR